MLVVLGSVQDSKDATLLEIQDGGRRVTKRVLTLTLTLIIRFNIIKNLLCLFFI